MSKADSKPAEEMSMEDILASIRKMIAQDQDVMDASRTEPDSGLPSEEPMADDEILDLMDEVPENSVSLQSEQPAGEQAPVWDAPPEQDIADFNDGATDAPLDLETEFAIQDDQYIQQPIETAAAYAPQESQSWGPVDGPVLVHEPITVGLTDMMEPVQSFEPIGGEPDLGDIPRFLDEPPETAMDTAYIDEPDDNAAEPTIGEPVPVEDGIAPELQQEVASMDNPTDRILSPEAAVKTSTAFDQLARTLISGYEGDTNTLEGVVRAMLKPLLKEWLDANLPSIVEDIVQAEIRRLSR